MRFAKWIVALGITLSFPISVGAIDLGEAELGDAGKEAGITSESPVSSLGSMVGLTIAVVLNILGVLLLIYFLYAGFLWMTARGDGKQTQKAKDIMQNAVIGLVITLTANSVVFFLAAELPGGGLIGTTNLTNVEESAGLGGTNFLLEDNIAELLSIVLNLLGVVLLLLFIYAGFLWMTAQGDGKQTQKAKDIMRNAVIGLVIILSARVIAGFVIEQLGADGSEVGYKQPQPIHNVEG